MRTRTAMPARMENDAFVGANGMTLYTFDKDAADADRASGEWSIVTRDDGRKQWAHRGKPLYYWIKDQKSGDKTGDEALPDLPGLSEHPEMRQTVGGVAGYAVRGVEAAAAVGAGLRSGGRPPPAGRGRPGGPVHVRMHAASG